MERCCAYIVVSEGSSERAYIQQLRTFLENRMPVGEDFRPRLNLIPKVTNNGSGGGQFSLVLQAYNKCRKADKHTPVEIWVDVDIYIRNEGAVEERNAKCYASKRGVPDFLFSVMNFEDFLALHFDDDVFEDWYARFAEAGHFKVPLHGAQHMPLFVKVWEEHARRYSCKPYSKGDLPSGFISKRSIVNMMRHVTDKRMISIFRSSTRTPTFAEFLTAQLRKYYPEDFPGGK